MSDGLPSKSYPKFHLRIGNGLQPESLIQSPLRAAELCTWVLHSHRWGKNEAKIKDSEKERMFATAMRMMAAKAKKGKPKMKPIEPRTPPEQTQSITRAIFDVIKEHEPLTIADAWDHLKILMVAPHEASRSLSKMLTPSLDPCHRNKETIQKHLQGTIRAEPGNLKSLMSLDLGKNNISGTIPPTLEKLKSLIFLLLNDNHLSVQIPRELVSLPNLIVVDLSNNFCGTIPTSGPSEHIPLNK